ncbi:MAG: hypothetical protein F6K58_26310 [Symploca sp. SIO2E9]|nr:hypothetical protein [Symploca sp. SIO2E9]
MAYIKRLSTLFVSLVVSFFMLLSSQALAANVVTAPTLSCGYNTTKHEVEVGKTYNTGSGGNPVVDFIARTESSNCFWSFSEPNEDELVSINDQGASNTVVFAKPKPAADFIFDNTSCNMPIYLEFCREEN